MAEQPEQHGATEQVITSAISAIRSALENNPQLYSRFLDMLANGRLQRDAEIVLALARDATALRQFLSLLSVPAERVIGAYQDWAQRARETAASSTALPAGTAVTPASSAAPQPTARPDLDVAALVGDAPFRAPETLPPRPLLYALLGHTYLQQGHHRQQKGQSNRARSEYLRAVEAFAEALRDAPDSPELHLYLATAHERLAQEAEALRHYVAALPLLPQQATALLSRIHQMLTPELAPALAGQQEWLASFAASPDLPSTAHPRLEILLARLALYKGSTKATLSAITHFDHALTYEPENVYALEGKGEALWRLGRAEEAAALLQQAVAGSDARASQRRQTATRLKLAQILIDLQRWAEASPLIEQALQGDPSFRPQLMLAQGWCHLAGGETEQARTLAGEVLAGSPADPAIRVEAYTQRAEAQLKLQDYTAANEDARAALDLAPNHQVAIRIRAEALIRDPQQPDVEKGIQLLQLYLRNAPSDVERLQLLLEALRTAGRPPSAIIETLERSLPAVTGERQGELLLALAAAYRQAGQPEKVLATLSRVSAAGDIAGSSPWWWLDGAARAELGDLEQALESYSRAVALDTGNLPLVEEHARLLTQSGRLDDALALWEVVSAVPSEQGRAALEVARLHRQRGDLPAALDSLDGALAGELETGQRQEALELRCQLADEAPLPPGDAAAVFLEAGRFYYDNNQTDSAITALRRARAGAGGSYRRLVPGRYAAHQELLARSALRRPPAH